MATGSEFMSSQQGKPPPGSPLEGDASVSLLSGSHDGIGIGESPSMSQELPHPLFYEDEAYDFQREPGVLSLVDSLPATHLIERFLPAFELLDMEREADTLWELAAVSEDLSQGFDRASCFDSSSDLPLGLLAPQDGHVGPGPVTRLETMTSLADNDLLKQMHDLLPEELRSFPDKPTEPVPPTPTLQLTPPGIGIPPVGRLPSLHLLFGMTRSSR